MATYPLRVCKTGMILALPRKAFSEEELEEAKNNPEEELLGPSQVVTTSIKGSTDFEAELAVVLVEFNMSVRSQLAKRTRKMTKAVIGFAEDLDSLPDLKELEEICATWLESGLVRNENFITANEDGLAFGRRQCRSRDQQLSGAHGGENGPFGSSSHFSEVPTTTHRTSIKCWARSQPQDSSSKCRAQFYARRRIWQRCSSQRQSNDASAGWGPTTSSHPAAPYSDAGRASQGHNVGTRCSR